MGFLLLVLMLPMQLCGAGSCCDPARLSKQTPYAAPDFPDRGRDVSTAFALGPGYQKIPMQLVDLQLHSNRYSGFDGFDFGHVHGNFLRVNVAMRQM